jgi:hypothetical protein
MALGAKAQAFRPSNQLNPKRNFILQHGLCEPAAETCPLQYSALLFQPKLIGLWLVLATILQAKFMFVALGAVLWWSALVPRLNPFDALYNRIFARSTALTPAPAPRRFAQFLAGSFALAIALSLALGWHTSALVLEGFLIAAVAALVLGGFCLGSFVFHVLRGHAAFARRNLPWAR